jgi:RNA polymerase sigma-70 factor (family 1)
MKRCARADGFPRVPELTFFPIFTTNSRVETFDADTDLSLFARIAEGNEQAFAQVFHIYTAQLFPAVVKITRSEAEAEEIIQEAFLRLWLHRAELPGIANPGAWLHTVAANLSLTHLRKRARERKRVLAVSETTQGVPEDAGGQLDVKWMNEIVEQAVAQLPPSRKAVFTLSRIKGMSRREIAETLGVSESTVKNQLTAALKFIQDHLDKKTGVFIPCWILFVEVLKKI